MGELIRQDPRSYLSCLVVWLVPLRTALNYIFESAQSVSSKKNKNKNKNKKKSLLKPRDYPMRYLGH